MTGIIKRLFTVLLVSSLAISASYAQDVPPSADEVMKSALKQAKKEKKNVFIIFHASWCGWCHKMDDAMNDSTCKKFFTDNYVIKHLVVMESGDKKHLENPGADSLLAKYHGDKSGIPFWLIFDKKGTLIGDSQIRPEGASLSTRGENIGCPAQPNELAQFEKVVKSTSSINDAQWQIIKKRFSALITKK